MLVTFGRRSHFICALIGLALIGCGGEDKKLESENAALKQELAKYQTVIWEGEEYLAFPKEGKSASERLVYYKIPFASPPNLTFPNEVVYGYKITEQKADCFKLERAVLEEDKPEPLRIDGPVQVGSAPPQEIFAESKLKWRAEGRPAK